MNKSILVQYIFSLTKIEIREFRLWLTSPVHNSKVELVRLFDFIIQFYEEKETIQFTKEVAFTATFLSQDYKDKRLRYMMSFLLQQVKQYLIWKTVEENEVQQQQFLLKQLRERKLNKAFEQEVKKTNQLLNKEGKKNVDYYYEKYQLDLERHEYFETRSRGEALPIKDVAENFSVFSIANTLKWQCNIITHKSVLLKEYDDSFFQKILIEIQNGWYNDIPTIMIYYQIYQALTTQKIEFYEKLKSLINEHFDLFSKNEIRDMLLLAINFCIKKLNQGKATYLSEIFGWYKKGFELGVFIKNGELSRFTYNNVVIAGLKLKEYDWIRDFMENHKKYIDKTYQHDTYYFNLALWYQYQNQFDEVLELLLKVSFKDVLHNLHAKQLMLKIYYKMGAFSTLESLLGSIKVYLHRQKQLGYHRQNYLKLIRYIKKLIQLNPHDKVAKMKLREEIENEKSLLDKRWFLEVLR